MLAAPQQAALSDLQGTNATLTRRVEAMEGSVKQRGRETAEVEARLAEGAKALAEQRELVAELKGELGEKNKVSARQGYIVAIYYDTNTP